MAKKITALTALSGAPVTGDLFPLVDISDTTDSAAGTTKKLTLANLAAGIYTETASSIDIDGGTIDGNTIGGNTPAAGTFADFISTGITDTATTGNVLTLANGTASFSSGIRISNGEPDFIQTETDASADNQNWRIQVSGEALSWQVVSDDFATVVDFMTVDRTGTLVDDITLTSDILNIVNDGFNIWRFETGFMGAVGAGARLMNVTPSATVPSLTPVGGDDDTGIGRDGIDVLSLISGGVQLAKLTTTSFEVKKVAYFATTTLSDLGAELITNGAFAADTDWVKGTGWTIGSGTASSDGSQGGDADLTQTISITNGKTYEITFTVSNYSAGNVTPVLGDTEGTDRAANGEFTEIITAGAGGDVDLRADLNFVGDIDDVTVKLANVTWDTSANQVTAMTLNGDRVMEAPTNIKDGATYILRLIQDGTGTRLITWNAVFKWPGGTAPTLSTGAADVDYISFISDGTNMNGVAQLDFS